MLFTILLSMEPWAAAKITLVSVVVPPAHVRAPSQRSLAPSVASVTSVANDKSDNEMILGAEHDYFLTNLIVYIYMNTKSNSQLI